MNTARTSELARSFVILGVALALVFAGSAINQLCAESIPVPNASFEEIYKPGSTTVTASLNGWTHGVGPNTPMHGSQTADYSDGTSGTSVHIPGWINSDPVVWPPPYGDWEVGSGSVTNQTTPPDGEYYFTANGGGWGATNSGACESDAPLTTVQAGLTYTVSMLVNGPVLPVVLDLLANDVPLTPSSTVDPGAPYSWSTVSKTYDAASLTGHLGESLRIRVGWGGAGGSTGSQSHLDVVTLDAVPEPSTLVLAVLGLLSLAWYGWRRR